MVLTAGQIILVFFIVFAFFSTSIVIFVCELIHKSMKNQKMKKIEEEEEVRMVRKAKKINMVQYPGTDPTKWGDLYQNTIRKKSPPVYHR